MTHDSQTAPAPTFLFIGGDRCGSKSLHNMFRQHPDCYVPPIADPYFFDKNYDRGINWYLGLFAAAPPDVKAIGEFSHDYIHSPEAAQRIARHLPGVKLLATLRHPIERTFSSYLATRSAGFIHASFAQALRETPLLIENSLYADRLEIYFELFDRNQIKVLFFDDLEADPRQFGKQAFQFVGLNPLEEIDYWRRMSQSSGPRLPYSGMISKQAANFLRRMGWVNLLGRAKSNALMRSIFYRPYEASEKPRPDPQSRQMLQETFAPQIDRLEKMLHCDLSHWRK